MRSDEDAEAKLHGSASLDDEQVATVVVADIVEHGADDAHSYKVHDPLWELSSIDSMSLKQSLELLGTSGTFVHDVTSRCNCAIRASRSDGVIAPLRPAVVIAWRTR